MVTQRLPPSAIRRIDAAKLLRSVPEVGSVPEVAEYLKSGSLNLSQAVLL